MNVILDKIETIVEYSASKAAFNGYPERIVSPVSAGPCCVAGMRQLGEIQSSPSGPYIYKACTTCGHTVRHFLLTLDQATEAGLVD